MVETDAGDDTRDMFIPWKTKILIAVLLGIVYLGVALPGLEPSWFGF